MLGGRPGLARLSLIFKDLAADFWRRAIGNRLNNKSLLNNVKGRWYAVAAIAGGGLRFLTFEEQRLVVRVDYGHGNEDGQIYFSVSEAF
jgi:hypothetical protein